MRTAALWSELPSWVCKALLAWEERESRAERLFPQSLIVAGRQENGEWQVSYRDDGVVKLLMLRPRRGPRVVMLPMAPFEIPTDLD
jgi:hypothetical protein